jgi:hypothetical protein
VRVRDFAVWRFEGGKLPEISAIQDQFLLLNQIGYLPEEVYVALRVLADGRRRAPKAGRTCTGGGAGPVLTLYGCRYVDSVGRVRAAMCRYRGINGPPSFLPGPRESRVSGSANQNPLHVRHGNPVMCRPPGQPAYQVVRPDLKASGRAMRTPVTHADPFAVMTEMTANGFIR